MVNCHIFPNTGRGASTCRVDREVISVALDISETLSGPVTVLALKGHITLGEGTQVLRNRITLALEGALGMESLPDSRYGSS
jgi:hypothetical protein